MKAVVKTAPGTGHVELLDVKEPSPKRNQVKMEISSCGICGTDIHVYNDTFRNYPPVILGHEFVGRVVEEGADVKGTTDRSARYAVLGANTVTCGHCDYCRSGEFMFCPDRRGMGHGVNGAFALYACVRTDQLFRLNDELPEEAGTLLEPLAAAVHAVMEIAILRPNDIALVSGPGPIGLLCSLVLIQEGIPTIVAGTSKDAERLSLIKTLGAAAIVNVEEDDLMECVREATQGLGVDIAFEVSGAAASAKACLEAVRPLGQYIQVGHFGNDISLPFDHVAFKQLQVLGSVGYTAKTWTRSMNLLKRGLNPVPLITHRFPISQWKKGFDLFESGEAIKVLLTPEV